MAEDSSFFGMINDNFAELAKTYLGVEAVKAQAGALRANSEYQALTNYNPSYTANPNAQPYSAQQLAAMRAGQMGGLGVSTPMLLLGGFALVALVLVLK